MSWGFYKPYVKVADRRRNAQKEVGKLAKKGRKISPVVIEGRKIAATFWGNAWCDNLESYSDYSNRLPRGRTYVRNGSVVDLQILPGKVTALVSGSEVYQIEINIKQVQPKAWADIKSECTGKIASVVELLQGKLSKNVIEVVTRADRGLFPKPNEIELDCSCPDGASMCKHVAATLYGVGARLDRQPELLFVLRKVDHLELIEQADNLGALPEGSTKRKTIAAADLADVFGVEMDTSAPATAPTAKSAKAINAVEEVVEPKGKRVTRGRLAVSGEESVLTFVKHAGQPNAHEINAHWSKEGRSGTADNTILKLIRAGKLLRVVVTGERGGQYTIA